MFNDFHAWVDEDFPVNVHVIGDFEKIVFCDEQYRCEGENFHEIKTGEFFFVKLEGLSSHQLALKTKDDEFSDPEFFDMTSRKQKHLGVHDRELRKNKNKIFVPPFDTS